MKQSTVQYILKLAYVAPGTVRDMHKRVWGKDCKVFNYNHIDFAVRSGLMEYMSDGTTLKVRDGVDVGEWTKMALAMRTGEKERLFR